MRFIENEHLYNFILTSMYFNEAKKEKEIFELWRKGYNNCDIAQYEGTLFDKKDFIINYLDRTYDRIKGISGRVGEISARFPNSTLLITMQGHIVCSKNGIIYDTFDCRNREVEYVWKVE